MDGRHHARVLVTGGTRGIGAEVARQMAARGAAVLVAGRRSEDAAAVAASLADVGEVRALDMALDVADPAHVDRLADAVVAQLGGLDVLVNNAAGYVDWAESASAADLDAAEAVMQVNLYGSWRVTQAVLPLLRQSPHARVVNVSSGAGSHGDPAFGLTRRGGAAATYGISKAALNALTATLAAELADTGILVNAVCPGLTATWPGAEATGARPVADGAASVVWAASLPDDGPTGGFFRDGSPLPW